MRAPRSRSSCDILAWNKLNRFHWHLSDDEAWRVEIDAYPELTKIGAWRGHGLPVPPLLGSGPEPSGGYYSKEAIREIVALGRAGSASRSCRRSTCRGTATRCCRRSRRCAIPARAAAISPCRAFQTTASIPRAKRPTRVLETIFDELIELFPFKTIHIGADEVPLGAWSGSPQALARLREIGGEAMAEAHAKRLNVVTNAMAPTRSRDRARRCCRRSFCDAFRRFSPHAAASPAAGRRRRTATSSTRQSAT